MNSKNKKAQILGLSFQMIFSIILIAVFLYVAFIGIRAFIENTDKLKVVNFVTDFRTELEKAIASTETSVVHKYDLPKFIEWLCFTPYPKEMNNKTFPELNVTKYPAFNIKWGSYVFFYPLSNAQKIKMSPYAKVDCEVPCLNLTILKNPYCIENKNGVASIRITKNIGKPYVTIA